MAVATTTALAAASLTATAASTYTAYEGKKEQAKAARSVSDYNARLRENDAIQQDAVAHENIRRTRAAQRRFRSGQTVRVATSGVTESGSALEVLADTAARMELEIADQKFRAERARVSALAGASATRFEGASIARGLEREATGTIMSGAAQMASSGYGFYNEGAFN